jgi:hypothetical protein
MKTLKQQTALPWNSDECGFSRMSRSVTSDIPIVSYCLINWISGVVCTHYPMQHILADTVRHYNRLWWWRIGQNDTNSSMRCFVYLHNCRSWRNLLCNCFLANLFKVKYSPQQYILILLKYVSNTILEIIHRPVPYLKHDVLQIGFCFRFKMEPTMLGPMYKASCVTQKDGWITCRIVIVILITHDLKPIDFTPQVCVHPLQ